MTSVDTRTTRAAATATFVVFGGLTLVVGLLIRFLIPESKPAREPERLSSELRRFGSLLKSPVLLGTFVMLFCGVYTFFVMVTWLPTFLEAEWGLEPSQAGLMASLAFWIAIPGGILMGFLSDRVRSRRPFVLVLVPLAVGAILLLTFAPNEGVLLAAILLYGAFGKLALDPVLISSVADNIPNDMRSSAYGLYTCIGLAAAILAPPATGALVDTTGSFQTAFLVAAGLLVLGAVVFLSLFRERKNPIGPRENAVTPHTAPVADAA